MARSENEIRHQSDAYMAALRREAKPLMADEAEVERWLSAQSAQSICDSIARGLMPQQDFEDLLQLLEFRRLNLKKKRR